MVFLQRLKNFGSLASVFIRLDTTKRQTLNLSKKCYSTTVFYATLYKKPWNTFAVRFRVRCLSGLIGIRFLEIMASKLGDDALFQKNNLHMCTATVKLALSRLNRKIIKRSCTRYKLIFILVLK